MRVCTISTEKSACNDDRGAKVWTTKGRKNERRRIQEESRMVRRKDDAAGVVLFVATTITSGNGTVPPLYLDFSFYFFFLNVF